MALAGGLVAGLAACSRWPVPPGPASGPARQLQVVAHPDDDLLFMSPDVAEGVRAGRPSVTVVLTAGESDVPDASGYAAARQAGSRAAYAAMAVVADDWRAEELALDAGHTVELYTLRARPTVQLVFVNLPDDNDPRASGGRGALLRLWRDSSGLVRVRSLVPDGAAVRSVSWYTRDELVGLLGALLARFAPTVLRVQDPQPDHRYAPDWRAFHDHPDHVMAARLAGEAAQAWAGTGTAAFVQLGYRDYNTEAMPANLPLATQRDKIEIFGRYVPHDRLVGTTGAYDAWPRRMLYRWPRGSGWVARDPAGLGAVAIVSGRPVGWRLDAGGRVSGPSPLPDPGGPLAPALSVVVDGLGRLCVFGLRTDTRRVLGLRADGTGWEPGWTDLGSPNEALDRLAAPDLGCPAAATAGDGRLVLVARNGAGGVSAAVQGAPGRGWPGPWLDLGGTDVQDTPAAVTAADGRVHVLASGVAGALRWVQTGPAGFVPGPAVVGAVPAGPPVAVRAGADLVVVYPVAGTADLALAVPGGAVRVLPGPGGPGTPALAFVAPGRLALAGRGPAGQLRTAAVMVPDGAISGWSELADPQVDGVVDGPALAAAGNGAVLAVALTDRGELLTRTVL